MKALVGAFNQGKALVGALSVIVQPVVEPLDRFAALVNRAPFDNSDIITQFINYGELSFWNNIFFCSKDQKCLSRAKK